MTRDLSENAISAECIIRYYTESLDNLLMKNFKMRKEVVMVWFKIIPNNVPGERKTMKDNKLGQPTVGWGLNPSAKLLVGTYHT